MKIIINESQLRLIIESENKGRLMNVPSEMLTDKESYDKIYNLYKDNKDRKNYIGIKVIGDLDLSGGRYGMNINSSVIKFCDELIEVDGYLRVVDNYTIGFPKLRKVTGDMLLSMVDVRSLPELRYVGRNLTLKGSKISELPELESVGGGLYLSHSKIKSLPKLESTGGDLFLNDSPLADLGNLKSVGGDLDLGNCQIKSLPMLSYVEGGLTLLNSKISSLPMLEYVGSGFFLRSSLIESLPMLKYVGENLNLKKTPLSKTTTEEELRNKIEVRGEIIL